MIKANAESLGKLASMGPIKSHRIDLDWNVDQSPYAGCVVWKRGLSSRFVVRRILDEPFPEDRERLKAQETL